MPYSLLQAQNLYLRALEPEDIESLYSWENNTSLWHYGATFAPFSKHVLAEYIANSHEDIYTAKQQRFMVCTLTNMQAIGTIDVYDFCPQNNRAGIGIFIVTSEQGKGYAAEALEILIRYCKDTLQMRQVYCEVATNNAISLSLFKKAGFEQTGIKKSWKRIKHDYIDVAFLQKIL